MKLLAFLRAVLVPLTLSKKTGPLQCRLFQHGYIPRNPRSKPKRYNYPPSYDPYGPRPPPSDKIVQRAERMASLPYEELNQIGLTLRQRLNLPKMVPTSTEGMYLGPKGGSVGSAKIEEKMVEKTAFDVNC